MPVTPSAHRATRALCDGAAKKHLLFFDRTTPAGHRHPNRRPYTIVTASSQDTVTGLYQWRQGSDQPCCPTGIGQVRFQLGDDTKRNALDPIPNH